MNKIEKLKLAESIVSEMGSYSIFQRVYTNFRQLYDIETSIEMALQQQDLLEFYLVSQKRYNTEDA